MLSIRCQWIKRGYPFFGRHDEKRATARFSCCEIQFELLLTEQCCTHVTPNMVFVMEVFAKVNFGQTYVFTCKSVASMSLLAALKQV